MARSAALILGALAAISAAAYAQRALKIVKDDNDHTFTSMHYLGFCDPAYESTNGTIQFHKKYTCSADNLLEVKYYAASDTTCTGAPYLSSYEITTHGGNPIDARPVAVTLPSLGSTLYATARLSVPSMENALRQAGIVDSLFHTYSCVNAKSDDLDLKTATATTYRDEGCPETGTVCNFERTTTNYCAVMIDKNRGNWATSFKIDEDHVYIYDGAGNCDGRATKKIKATETFLEKCTTSFGENGEYSSEYGFSNNKCADYGNHDTANPTNSDIGDGRYGYTKYETGIYLDEDGAQQQSGAGATFGALPLAIMAGAQVFGNDAPLLRAVAVTLAVVAFTNPTTAERTLHYKADSATLGSNYQSVNRVCEPRFKKPSQTQLLNEMLYGVLDGYEWKFCESENRYKVQLFGKDDSECEKPLIDTTYRLDDEDDTLKSKASGYFTTQSCYKSANCGAPDEAAISSCKTAATAKGASVSPYVTDTCAINGCFSELSFTSCSEVNQGCDASTNVQTTCTANDPIDTVTSCPEAPEGLGYLKVWAFADDTCTTPCNYETIVTGYCTQHTYMSTKHTVTGSSVVRQSYSNSITCGGVADAHGLSLHATPLNTCLNANTYNSTTTSVSKECVVGYGRGGGGANGYGAMSYKIEYVADSKGASGAAGLAFYSVTTVVAVAAVVTQLLN